VKAERIVFDSPQIKNLRGSCVYIVSDQNKTPVYVGSSKHGLYRVFSPIHSKVKRTFDYDSLATLELIPCSTIAVARRLERKLIQKLKPEYNQTNKY